MVEENVVYGADPVVPLLNNYSLGKLLLESLKLHNEKTCLIDAIKGETVTYRWLLEKTVRAAESMKSLGLSKNDVISVSSENHLNFYIPVIAALYLGLQVAPLNHSYNPSELMHTMNISKPKIVFCASSMVDKFLELREKTLYVQLIISLESDEKIYNVENLEEFLSRSPFIEDPNKYEAIELNPVDHVAIILCSSGTTGLPKGVMVTHLNLLTSLCNHQDPRFTLFKQSKENTNLGMLPFFHGLGFITVFTAIIWGSRVVVMKRFEEKLFLQTIQDYKIGSLMLVPPIMVFLAKSPLVSNYDLSSVKHITCGASPLSEALESAVKKRLNLKEIRQGYGLTEATLAIIINPVDDIRVGSSGKVVPHMKCKVSCLETGKSLGVGQRGELCFKGLMVSKGYYGNPKATQDTFDKDGWLRTGDVGYYDKDGYFYIVDRIKELIKYKGFQVPPAELEYLLLTHPKIKDAAVIGVPNELAGELPKAYVVKQPGKMLTEAEVQQFVAKKVSHQKRLHGGVKFVEEIPKNPSGKILRRVLREQAKEEFLNISKL